MCNKLSRSVARCLLGFMIITCAAGASVGINAAPQAIVSDDVDSESPLIFPKDATRYKIIPVNETIISRLSHMDAAASEVGDMLTTELKNEKDILRSSDIDNDKIDHVSGSTQPLASGSTPSGSTKTTSETTDKTLTTPTMVKYTVTRQHNENAPKLNEADRVSSVPEDPNVETEDLQPTHDEKQPDLPEEMFNKHASPQLTINKKQQLVIEMREPLGGGSTAAILGGTFAAFAVLGYAGLIIWRQALEKRYGNRERLVTEDTYYTTNDTRHFEL